MPPSKDTCSFHHILLVHLQWLLCQLLGWVPCLLHLGVSSTCCVTHVKTTFGLRTLNLLVRILNTFSTTLMPLENPVVCYSFFACELSFAVGFQKEKQIVQIWPSFPQRFRWQKLQGAILYPFPQLAAIKYLFI